MSVAFTTREMIAKIAFELGGYRFRVGRELELQDGVELALLQMSDRVSREFRLDRGPIDFYLPDVQIGIECKIDGSHGQVARQLVDYAADSKLLGLILVTSKPSHVKGHGNFICEKPFAIVPAWRAL